MKNKKLKIIVVCGPTASGKSALAVSLAHYFNGEIISADSRQVYKGLDIGTGKITKKEMRGIPHYMLDVANPKHRYTVTQFQEEARKNLNEIFSRGKIPIVCGGTGFYISALVDGIIFPEVPPNAKLRAKLEKKSANELFEMLKKLDPRRAKEIDPLNKRRVIRAIEIVKTLGSVPCISNKTALFSTIVGKRAVKITGTLKILWIGLDPSPNKLRNKINTRLLSRIKDGMIEEVKKLHKHGLSWKRMEELGLEYRYLAKYLKRFPRLSASSLRVSAMAAELETAIWHYARRQMTWFRANKRIQWFLPEEIGKIKKVLKKFLY